ncbi:MAG: protein kinase [Phycisphaerae bacterium]|nr:protein kinase [Phycisphaerae bacterium]
MGRIADDLVFVRDLGTGANTRATLVRSLKTSEHYCRKSVLASAPNWDSQIRQMKNEFEVGQHNTHRALRQSIEFGIVRRRLRAVEAYILLRYVDGVPLTQWSDTASIRGIIKNFWHVADGLADLHRRGFVHADLKPANILCASNGRPTLIDFGQSCPIWHRKERIQGTADFIAPEQVSREPLDPRTDVFGFGATMHLVFLGKPTQTELNSTSVRRGGRVVMERRTFDRGERHEQLDSALLKLIEDCLEPDRSDRPANMELVKDRLEVCHGRMSQSA